MGTKINDTWGRNTGLENRNRETSIWVIEGYACEEGSPLGGTVPIGDTTFTCLKTRGGGHKTIATFPSGLALTHLPVRGYSWWRDLGTKRWTT
jgi:hypothetical protein